MKTIRWLVAVVATVLLTGMVGGCKKQAPKPLAQLLEPTVRIGDYRVEIDGEPIASTRMIEELGRMQKLDELFGALSQRRRVVGWVLPAMTLPPRLTLECDEHTSMLVVKSVFQTCAYAGYRQQRLPLGPQHSVEVQASLPTVAIFGQQPPQTPPSVLHLHVYDEVVNVVRKQGKTVVGEWKLPLGANHEWPATWKDKLSEQLSRQPLTGAPPELVVHSDDRLTYRQLTPTLAAVEAIRAKLPPRAGQEPAFDIVFSIR